MSIQTWVQHVVDSRLQNKVNNLSFTLQSLSEIDVGFPKS